MHSVTHKTDFLKCHKIKMYKGLRSLKTAYTEGIVETHLRA